MSGDNLPARILRTCAKELSTPLAHLSGVPQGSLLGPLFFVIFMSDLPEVVLPGSTIALYADDCKCSRIIDTAGDLELFQQDLDSLHQWSVRNFINFIHQSM